MLVPIKKGKNMARGKTIPPLIRQLILKMHEDGESHAEIGRQLRYNRQTIHRVIQRHQAAESAKTDA